VSCSDPCVDLRPATRRANAGESEEGTGPLRVRVVDRMEELHEYADAWNALSYEVPPRLPTSSYAWVSTCFEHSLKAHEAWCCVLACHGDHLVGVLPLVVSRMALFGCTRLHTPMGGHIIAVSPLVLPGEEEATVLRALLDAAWARHPDAVWIELRDVAANVPFLRHVHEHWHREISRRTGRYLRVDGDPGLYQASLSRNFRSNQRKAANKLRKLNGVDTAFVLGPEASSAQLPEFLPVEAAGWKGREGTAIQKSSALVAFYTTLTMRLADAGWLEWHFLRAEGRAIAANLGVRFNRSIIVWKLGYDEGYRQCSPGGMLFQSLLDRAFADPDIEEVNLLTDASWYDNWRMDEREYYRIRLYRRGRPVSILLGFVLDGATGVLRRSKTVRFLVRTGWRFMQRCIRSFAARE